MPIELTQNKKSHFEALNNVHINLHGGNKLKKI